MDASKLTAYEDMMAFPKLSGLCAALLISLSTFSPTAALSDTVMLSNGGRTGVAMVRSPGAALRMTSAERSANGLRGLRPEGRLQMVAQQHANWMARNGQMSHTGANGSRMSDRLRAAGYRACFAAENVAFGQRDDNTVVRAWMASSGHRRNILDRRATHGTVASASDGVGQTYWVMLLAQPC